MNCRKLYLILFTLISISGLLYSWFLLYVDRFMAGGSINYEMRKGYMMTNSVSSKLNICFPQSDALTTVRDVWNEIEKATEAVRITKSHHRFNLTVEKLTCGHLACYSISAIFDESNFQYDDDPNFDYIFEVEVYSKETRSKELRLSLHSPATSMNSQTSQEIVLPRMYSGERKNLHVVLSYSLIYHQFALNSRAEFCELDEKSRLDECLTADIEKNFGNGTASYFAEIKEKSDRILKKNSNGSIMMCRRSKSKYCSQNIFVPKVHSVVPSSVDKIVLIAEKTPTRIGIEKKNYSWTRVTLDFIFITFCWLFVSPVPYLLVEAAIKRHLRVQ